MIAVTSAAGLKAGKEKESPARFFHPVGPDA
jgi:hypothetical protein